MKLDCISFLLLHKKLTQIWQLKKTLINYLTLGRVLGHRLAGASAQDLIGCNKRISGDWVLH